MKTIHSNPIRVGIRGIAGLLGSRLALAIQKNPDIRITVGIVKNDPTLQRVLSLASVLGYPVQKIWAENMYLDERHRVVREVNSSQSQIRFEPADQLSLSKMCDVLVDTTVGASKWESQYQVFGKPVILQSGEYPSGRLIAPPLMEQSKEESNIYRQGDCILSGLCPVLAPFQAMAVRIRIHILMQFGERLNDYPTSQRTNATYRRDDLACQIQKELTLLFRDQEVAVEDILQVPGLDYYTTTVHLDIENPVSGEDVRELLQGQPRILMVPDSFTSTYEIDHFLRETVHALGGDIPPIMVYGGSLKPPMRDMARVIRIQVAFYSRLIAVLPNIDAIRILGCDIDPIAAMRMTDQYAGFPRR